MTLYMRNRSCACARCRTRGMMGGIILVTLGVLFLLDNYQVFYFDDSWPVLLIVIGLLSFAARNASTAGHVQPYGLGGQPTQGQMNPDQSGVNPQQTGDGREVKS